MPKVSILIVSHEKDFTWLKWCLKSIEKFTGGFHEVVVSIPDQTPVGPTLELVQYRPQNFPIRLHTFEDWPGKGFVRHMDRIIHADEICKSADFILHMDSDCCFVEPVTPYDYFVDGKPVLIGAPYDWILRMTGDTTHLKWKWAVDRAIGGTSEFEFMRRHPAVHHRGLYGCARLKITQHTRQNASEYIRSTQNEFPQGFCEFVTLGELAWRHFRDDYHWLRQDKGEFPHNPMWQFWSHAPLDKPQVVSVDGVIKSIVPLEFFNELFA